MQAHRCPVSLSLVSAATAALLLLVLAGIGAAAEPSAIQPLSRSAVVFMGGSTPELYAACGAAVVDWGGHAWRDQPGPIADFRKRVETAQKMGIQYNAGIGMITEFMGMYDFAGDRFEPQKDFVLRLAKPLVGQKAGTRKCTAYTPDGEPVSIPVERDGDALRLKVPELRLWAVLALE